MRKRLKIHQKLELLGLGLLLIAFGIQLFANGLGEIATAGEFYRVNDKLNRLWSWHHDLAVHRFQMDDLRSKELSYLNERFFAEENLTESVKHQAEIFLWFYASLYVIGSLVFILGRYLAFVSPDSVADI